MMKGSGKVKKSLHKKQTVLSLTAKQIELCVNVSVSLIVAKRVNKTTLGANKSGWKCDCKWFPTT